MSIQFKSQYKRGQFTLDIDVNLPNKGVTAIFGPSGSGKSTLLHLLGGFIRCKHTQIQFNGQLWQDQKQYLPIAQRKVGMVLQQPCLFTHLSVQDNITYASKRRRHKFRQAELASVIEQCIDILQLRPLLQRYSHQLSGGEQQRVAIARALASQPKLLLMDEPLANLDKQLKQQILPYLQQIQRQFQIPILYVSHSRYEVARLADQVLMLQAGKVVQQGSVSAMFNSIDDTGLGQQQAVFDSHVEAIDQTYHLAQLNCIDFELLVSADDLKVGQRVRVLIQAKDISISLAPLSNSSILNTVPVSIQAMQLHPEKKGLLLLQLDCGKQRLVAQISIKSAQQLSIKIGQPVYGHVKSVALEY